jgi:hypothetical protein
MAVWTSAGKVKTALNRLIETQSEVDKAQDELMKYQGAVSAPGVRNTYEGVEELLVYIREKTEYEKGLARAEGKVQDAKAARAEAANRVREFLPAGSQVIYDYHGPHGSGAPTRYTIHDDARGDVIVIRGDVTDI